jgi:hypothetical protein
MTPLDPRALVLIGWGIVCATLAAAIGAQLGWGKHVRLDAPRPRIGAPMKVDAQPLPEFGLPPIENAYMETVNRPLFNPTRRPPPPPPPPEPPKPRMQKGQFLLLGVVITPEKSLALLREIAVNKTRSVEKGKEVNGIRVEQVEREKVVLSQFDDREVLVLKVQPGPKPGAVPPAPPPGQPAPAGVPLPGQPVMAQPAAAPGEGATPLPAAVSGQAPSAGTATPAAERRANYETLRQRALERMRERRERRSQRQSDPGG